MKITLKKYASDDHEMRWKISLKGDVDGETLSNILDALR